MLSLTWPVLCMCTCQSAPEFSITDETWFSVSFKSPWPFRSWRTAARAVPAVQNCKWLPGFCSLQKLIRASLHLTGTNEELPPDWGVECDPDMAQYWKPTWKSPPVISTVWETRMRLGGQGLCSSAMSTKGIHVKNYENWTPVTVEKVSSGRRENLLLLITLTFSEKLARQVKINVRDFLSSRPCRLVGVIWNSCFPNAFK